MTKKEKVKPGPIAETLRIDGNWKDAVAKMLRGGATAAKPKAKAKTRRGKR